jgi:AraC family transcriptional regulator of arabinose operon
MNSLEDFLLFTAELSGQLARSGPSDPRILRAMQTVCADLAAPHSVASLARTAGLSPSRFAHLFKTETGLTPQRYIEQQRIERAAQLLLRTPFPVAEIARQVGFDCPFYFSTRFSHHTGRSPRNHRVLNGA